MEAGVKKNRMEWLDAMRGFTMILVVANHVALMSYEQSPKVSATMPFLELFRMPLFFFVSGFLAYKADFVWSAGNTIRLLGKKFRIQVFPALVFLCFYLILRKPHFGEQFVSAMGSDTKGGYWFTWALLQMFAVYYVFCFCIRRLPERWHNGVLWSLWVLSLVAYEFCYLPKVYDAANSKFLNASGLIQLMRYMHFFVMGNIVHRNWNGVQRLFDSQWFFPFISIVAFFCCADVFLWHKLQFAWRNLPLTMAMYCLMFIVVIFFRFYQQRFTRFTMVGRGLQYVGKRTLDVYLLHFILLPTLPAVGKWLNQFHPNFVLELVATIIPAIIIVAFCLLISDILRISPHFSENFFGRKVKKD